MFRDKNTLRIVISLLMVVSLFGLNASHMVTAQEASEVKTVDVNHGDYIEKTKLRNLEMTYLRSDPLAIATAQGTFVEYIVSDGQMVKKGDPLVSYQIPTDPIALEENKLRLKHSETNDQIQLEQRKAAIDEKKTLLQSLDRTTHEALKLEISIKKMEIGLEQYQFQTEKNLTDQRDRILKLESDAELQYINAPYDGFVRTDQRITEGTVLNQNIGVIQIIDPNSAVLRSNITLSKNLWYGMEVFVEATNLPEKDRIPHKGKIIAIDSLYNGKVSTGNVLIQLEDEELTPSIPKADIESDAVHMKNVIVIPLKVVKSPEENAFVYIQGENGAVYKQYITGRHNGTNMWVYSGLTKGQRIIAE